MTRYVGRRFLPHPSAPAVTACPGCGQPMGDGDRVTYGRCGRCRRRTRPCWCGRVAVAGALECAEHDGPIPAAAQAPSDPSTPGGVFDRLDP